MGKIYTRTGDKGETGLFGGPRVRKSDPRIEAYGAVDELNASLGRAGTLIREEDLSASVRRIQNDLFDIGAFLAAPNPSRLEGRGTSSIRQEDVDRLEQAIDRYDRELPPLRNFVLPGGSELASLFHQARTVCRRAEREIVRLAESQAVDPLILAYVNRLSDLLFILARWANIKEGIAETAWEKKG
mgnify:CR=1 FL=1